MAAGKKKKKPVSNPARGFATISIASKPKTDLHEPSEVLTSSHRTTSKEDLESNSIPEVEQKAPQEENLTAEEFERRLEESELQILVEKYAMKSKKDAHRQVSRLCKDQRVLRSQAEILNTKKWLPAELIEEILQLIKAEGQFISYGESPGSNKQTSQEILTVNLWTLQQVLKDSGFPLQKVYSCLHYVLSISDKVRAGSKDKIWGLEESLDWLSRECTKEELPAYESYKGKVEKNSKALSVFYSSNQNTASSSHIETESGHEKKTYVQEAVTAKSNKLFSPEKVTSIDSDSDYDPDDLLPTYLDCKTQLHNLRTCQFSTDRSSEQKIAHSSDHSQKMHENSDLAKVLKKLKKIEEDILFDKYLAEEQWQLRRAQLETATDHLSHAKVSPENSDFCETSQTLIIPDKVDKEATRLVDPIPDQENSDDDDTLLADFFSSLPVDEIEQETEKRLTVINESSDVKVTVRDMGKWSGINPKKLLEESCRIRDPSVKISYTIVSKTSFSNRHCLQITWSKTQQITCSLPETIDFFSSPNSHSFTMSTVSSPDPKQSEAYVATTALYCLFGSGKEERIFNRLPSAWRSLWTEYADFDKEQVNKMDRTSLRVFRDMVREKIDQQIEEGVLILNTFKTHNSSRATENDETSTGSCNRVAFYSENYIKIWLEKSNSPAYQRILQSRMQLPIWSFKEKVLSIVEREQIVIICGETGCGKSTQIPSFILEHQLSRGMACKIYVTEPRRLSAISLARRVCEELGENRNDLGTNRSLVGYAIRLESNLSKETCLVYATTGIVMRILENSNDLKDITHIILDEVHERTIDCDFLLIVLKKILTKRSDLKIILMSATVDAERFSKYLDGAPIINIPGRTYPVQVKYLEDIVELTGYSLGDKSQEKYIDLDEDMDGSEIHLENFTSDGNSKTLKGYGKRTRNTILQIDEYRIDFELITHLLVKIANDPSLEFFSKAILVFLPGIGEIRQLNDILSGHPVFSLNWYIYPLHSTIANEDQEAAFLLPPLGIRKIVLATNIAETGITIPDVTCVIDTGKHREMRFDEKRQFSRLVETFISRANAKQRRGRAGRVQEGICFHMFTKYRHDKLMIEQQTPEFLRLSLQDLAIRVKICKLGSIEEILGQAMDPPLPKNVRRAIDALIDVRALTTGEDLTPLGFQLAKLPLDVFLGKLVLLGSVFKCLDASITIAAIVSSKSPFSAPFRSRAQADLIRLSFRQGDSDLLTVYNAYLTWKRICLTNGTSETQFCRKNFLSQQTLANIEDLKCQLTINLCDSGFLPLTETERGSIERIRQFIDLPQRSNMNSGNDLITTSVITWSFYPRLLVRDGKGYRNYSNNRTISLHPSSVNKGHYEIKWLSYYHIMKAKQFYNAHETTAAQEFSIALLCGDARFDVNFSVKIFKRRTTNFQKMYAGVISLDGNRARFAISDWKTMLVIKILGTRLREILLKSFKNPGKSLTPQHQKWMEILQKIYSQEFTKDDK